MKKTALLSAFLGIFAGFLFGSVEIAMAQSTLSKGTSVNTCQSQTVKLEIREGKKVWDKCEEGASGCKLMFCNALASGGSTPSWDYDNCHKYCVGFQEELPIGQNKIKSISANSGTELVLNYVSMIYKFGAAILGIIAVLVIVVSGVQMIAGGVDENNYTAAKDRILQAILSLVLLFSSALILTTINPGFFT